jgi:microcystin-dependent protein
MGLLRINELAPVASTISYAGETPPEGWLICDGSAISRSEYADLFGVLGETFGAGDGSTTFNLPDLADRIPVGKGSTKTSLGAKGGDVSGTPSGSLSGGGVDDTTITTSTMPNHVHQEHNQIWMNAAPSLGGAHHVDRDGVGAYMTVTSTGGGARDNFNTGGMGGGSAHGHTYHNPSFSGNSMSVEQPYTVLNYIIKH